MCYKCVNVCSMCMECVDVCLVCHCVLVMTLIRILSYLLQKLLEFLVTEALYLVL